MPRARALRLLCDPLLRGIPMVFIDLHRLAHHALRSRVRGKTSPSKKETTRQSTLEAKNKNNGAPGMFQASRRATERHVLRVDVC